MSTEVEQKVVEMRFDNKNFEKNVSETMSTLDKLKEKLNFRGIEKSFDGISSSARGVNLSPISGAVDTVMAKFSAFDAITFSVLQNLTNRAISAGEQLVKSLTIDQISAGWGKYEDETKAVQTILNAQPELSIQDVEKELARLTWYTDETSYSYSDMIDSIGQFTSYGIKLQDAVTAMEGLSNWAAASGQGINEARSAMRNLSQAMASGVVKWEDWKSVAQTAHMSTEEFKNAAIESAKALGLLTKKGKTVKGNIVDTLSFDKTLSDEWFTKDVLMDVLTKYGRYTDKVYNYIQGLDDASISCAEAMERVSDAGMELSANAFKAGQESKTLTDSIEATKDAASTIWKDIFKSIFGNYEESKKLWTNLTSDLWDIFVADVSDIRDVIKDWGDDEGGREDVFAAISNSLSGLKSVLDVVRDAFKAVFPPITAETLKKFSTSLKKFSEKLILSEEKADKLQRTLQGLFAILDIVRIVITDAAQIGLTIFNTLLGKSTDKIGDMTANMGDSIVSFRDWIKEHDHSVESIKKICDKIATVRDAIKKWIDDHVHLRESLSKLREHIQNGSEKIGDFAKKIWELPAVQTAITKTKDTLAKFFDKAKEYFSEGYDRIKEFIDHLKTLDGFSFENIKEAIRSFKEIVLDHFFNIEGGVDKLKTAFTSMKDSVTGSFSKAGDSLDTFRDKITGFGKLVKDKAEAATNFSYKWGTTSNNLKTYALNAKKRLKEVVDVGDLLSIALGGTLILSIKNISDAFKTLNGFLKTFTNPIDALTGVFKGLQEIEKAYAKKISVDAMTKMIKGIAIAIAILVGVVFVLSKLAEKGTMWDAIKGLLAIAGIMVAMVAAMAAINKWLGSLKIDVGIQASILALAISIVILVKAMKAIGEIDDIFTAVLVITTLGAALTLLTAFMSKLVDVSDTKGLIGGALTIIAISVAIYILVSALKKLSKIHFDSIGKSLAALGVAIAGIAVLMLAAHGISIGGAIALIAAVIALQKLVKLLKKTTEEDIDKILKNLVKLIPVFLVFAGLMVASKFAGENAAKAGTAILLMSVSLLLVLQAIKMISRMSGSELAKGLLVVTLILAAFGALTALSKHSGKNAAKAGVMILLMSGALLIVAGAVKIFSSMSASELAKGVAAVVVLDLLMGAIIAMSKKSKDAKNTLIGMSIAIAVMSVSLIALSFIEWNRLLPAAGALSAVVLSLAAALSATKKIDKKAKSTILLFALIIAELATALFFLADKPWSSLLAAAGGLSLLLLSLSASFLILSKVKKLKKGVVEQLYALMGVIAILGGVLFAMQLLDKGDMSSAISAASGIGILLLALSGAFLVLSKAKKLKKGVVGQLYAMAGIMVILGGILLAMQVLSNGHMGSAILSAIYIGILLAELTVAFDALSKMKKLKKGVVGQLYAMAGIMVILGGILLAMQVFSGGNMDTAIKSALAISILLVVLVGATALFSLMKPVPPIALVSLAAMVVALGLIALILGLMAKFNVTPALETVLALSIMLMALVVATGLFSLIPPIPPIAFVSLAAMVVALGLVALILGLMAKFDVAPSIETALALSILLFALVLACIPLALIGALGTAVIAGAAVFDAVILVIGALLVGLGALMEYVPQAEEFLDKGIVVLEKIGSAIGRFFGSIIDGFMDSATQNLSDIGERLSDFMEKAQPFIEGAKQIDSSVVDGILNMAEVFAVLAGVNVLNAISTFLTFGEDPIESFAERLIIFGKAIREYSDIITEGDGINTDAIEASQKAAQMLADLENGLAKSGLVPTITGQKSLASFGQRLKEFGKAIVEYSATITGENGEYAFNADAIKASSEAAQMLSVLENGLAKSGLVPSIMGQQDLKKFGKKLKDFGEGMKSYSESVSGVDTKAIAESAEAAKGLVDVSNSLKNNKLFTNETTINQFGSQLKKFGSSFKDYSEEIKDIDYTPVSNNVTWLGKLVTETLRIPNNKFFTNETTINQFGSQLKKFGSSFKEYSESIKDIDYTPVSDNITWLGKLVTESSKIPNNKFFTNETTINQFGSQLKKFGAKFKEYVESIKDIDYAPVAKNIAWLGELVTATSVLPDNKFFTNETTINQFGSQLKKFGKKFKDYVDAIKDIDYDDVSNSITYVKKLMSMASDLIGFDVSGLENFGSALKKVAESGLKEFVSTFSKKDSVNKLKKVGTDIVDTLADSVNSENESLGTAGDNLMSGLIDVLKEHRGGSEKLDGFYGAGKYVVEGFAKGISDNKYIAEAAARKVAEAALVAAQTRLDEHSPSKESYKVGRFFVLGLANALYDGQSTVYDAGYGMADNAVSGLKKAIAGISDMIENEVDTQPTIRPVLDLSDIQNGTDRMNRIFRDRNISLSTETASALSSDISAEMNARTLVRENELLGKISDLLEDMDSRIGNEEETTPFVMNIENFNNNTDQDIDQLTDELSVRLATKLNRKRATFR